MVLSQGTQRIEVIVRKEGGGNGVQGAKEKTEGGNDNVNAKDPKNKDLMTSRMVRVNATHAVAIARQTTLLAVNYAIQGVAIETGDRALQQQIQRRAEIWQDTTGFATSVAMGAFYGAVGSGGNPIAIAVGAGLSAISSGASLAVKYANRQREFNYKTFVENNAIEYQRARANISLTTGRLR